MRQQASSGIEFRDIPPPPALRPWVASCWSLRVATDAAARRYWVVPDGCTHLVVDEGRVRVAGPRCRPARRVARPDSLAFGLRFHAGGARVLLALQGAPSLRDRTLAATRFPHLRPLTAWARTLLGGRPSLDDFAATAAEVCTDLIACATLPDGAVAAAVRAIQSSAPPSPDVERLGAMVGMSSRQLRRRFVSAVDLTPREYGRIWRFRRIVLDLLAADAGRWSQRAAMGGFADQSHLIREFQRLGGMAPQEFLRRLRNVDHRGPWDPASAAYRSA